jgi:excisionase family DNA binding protein
MLNSNPNPPNPLSGKLAIDIDTAAELLSLSRSSIRKLLAAGLLSQLRTGEPSRGRKILIPTESLQQFVGQAAVGV